LRLRRTDLVERESIPLVANSLSPNQKNDEDDDEDENDCSATYIHCAYSFPRELDLSRHDASRERVLTLNSSLSSMTGIGRALLFRVFVNRTRVSRRVNDLTVERVPGSSLWTSRHREDDGGHDEPKRSGNHEDDTHGREAKACTLIRNGPIHNGARRGGDCAEYHSGKTHVTPSSTGLTKCQARRMRGLDVLGAE